MTQSIRKEELMEDNGSTYYGTGGSNNPGEALVRGSESERNPGWIVVGVDGSAGSRAALDWAVQEAQLRGIPVHAVMTWEEPRFYGAAGAGAPGMNPYEEITRELPTTVAHAVAQLAEDAARGHEVLITSEAIEGHPAEALLVTAKGAAMLVVGSRGHGGFAGALLGSVSQHVVAHARCPVVVVPNLTLGSDTMTRPAAD
jgi:nucleotide-binding universal stress UspA family protein